MNSTQQGEIEEELIRLERMVRIYTLLSKETLRLLVILTREYPTLFTIDDLIGRLATFLNYFILQLCGPKGDQFKQLGTSEKYDFDPNWLLKKIIMLFINLSMDKDFLSEVSSDERSYNQEMLFKATTLMRNNNFEDIAKRFSNIVSQLDVIAGQKATLETLLSPIPDDFLDPILATLMRDPVKLPTSNITVDRGTITRILLTDPIDPFNRAPLTVEDLVPDTELKQKIDDWIESKLKDRKQ